MLHWKAGHMGLRHRMQPRGQGESLNLNCNVRSSCNVRSRSRCPVSAMGTPIIARADCPWGRPGTAAPPAPLAPAVPDAQLYKYILLSHPHQSCPMASTSGQCAKPRAVLTKEQAIDIFRLSASGYRTAPGTTATSVAKAFGVNEKTVRDIWNGRTWCDETLPLDSSRQPKPRKKTGRPMGRKDSAPRRPKQTPRQPKLIPKRETRPQDSRAVSDDSPQALLISKPNAKSQDGANVVTTGATRLLPDHSPQNLRLLSCESLSPSHSDTGPWKRDSIPTSLHPFQFSASIDGGALLTARPWPVLTPSAAGTRSSSAACWPAAFSAACLPAVEYNASFYTALHAHGQGLHQTRLSQSVKATPFDAPASLFPLDPALYAPRSSSLASPPAAFWNLAAAFKLPLHRAAQSARPFAADHAMSAAVPLEAIPGLWC